MKPVLAAQYRTHPIQDTLPSQGHSHLSTLTETGAINWPHMNIFGMSEEPTQTWGEGANPTETVALESWFFSRNVITNKICAWERSLSLTCDQGHLPRLQQGEGGPAGGLDQQGRGATGRSGRTGHSGRAISVTGFLLYRMTLNKTTLLEDLL